jgi:hypothetical protein
MYLSFKILSMRKSFLAYFIITLVIASHTAKAQITTAAIAGTITDQTTQAPLLGASVVAVHLPTNTRYSNVCIDGSYVFSQLKSGGPYSITASYVGYETVSINDLYLTLGNTLSLPINLQSNVNTLTGVTIGYDKNDLFNKSRAGTSTNINRKNIEKLPTLNRSLQDLTRLTPQSGANSFAGSNYRYNNLSIDGAASNDAFGFVEPTGGAGGSVASGTPGSLARSQPISLDAIQEVQVVLAPFDVNLGNFTGASINAITRSGSNKTEGSIYGFGRNQWLINTENNQNKFFDYQSGVRIGGAIKKNKLFYFTNVEIARRNEPVNSMPGTNQSNIPYEIAKAIADTLQKRYNYNAGSYTNVNLLTKNIKFLVRLDYNISKKHQLSLRNNFVDAQAEHLSRAVNILNFGGQGFTHYNRTNGLVAELKSQLNNKLFNTLILGYTNIDDHRKIASEIFPHIEITYNTVNQIFAGAYREAAVYQIKQNVYEFTNNLTAYRGKHTLMLGTHNELYKINYHFITPYAGRWAYSSVDNFFANKPSRIRATYNLTNNDYDYNYNNPSASYAAIFTSVYAQDRLTLTDRLQITAGVRVDMPIFPDAAAPSTQVQQTPQLAAYKNDYGGKPVLAPRVGFNWANKQRTIQLRGGSGVFVGRLPLAWLAYSYMYNGDKYGNIDVRPTTTVPLITKNFEQLSALQPNTYEINLVDNNFKTPRVWRSSLGIDLKLPDNTTLSLEGLYSDVLQDVLFKTINLKDSTTTTASTTDTRPVYLGNTAQQKINRQFTNVFLLTNTQQGFRYSLTATIDKKFDIGLRTTIAYNYGLSKDISNGVRVSPQANWEWNQTLNPNAPELSYSNFDIRHRVVANLLYTKNWAAINQQTTFALIFTAQSGSPFSYTYNGDYNRDGSPTNDLIFVPKNRTDINLIDIKDANGNIISTADAQWQQLQDYITTEPYLTKRTGNYAERNGARTPANIQADLRLSHNVHVAKRNLEVCFDMINAANLLNSNWGKQYFVPNTLNSSYQIINSKGLVNGLATYQFNNPTTKPYQIDNLASSWQGQLSLRFNF